MSVINTLCCRNRSWTNSRITQDLLTDLSIESQRTEKDHISFMNFFHRSWIQVAAGGENKYMKAQCIREQPVKTTGELPSGEKDAKVALYVSLYV